MTSHCNRREMLGWAGRVVLGGILSDKPLTAAMDERQIAGHSGCVVGQPQGAQAGLEVLAAGGNAVDAAVAAALVAGVVAVPLCGIGGYGGHMVIALARGKKVTAIDFNSTAPAAARPDMFPLDDRGQVNAVGWLAAGVPGTLAGL